MVVIQMIIQVMVHSIVLHLTHQIQVHTLRKILKDLGIADDFDIDANGVVQ